MNAKKIFDRQNNDSSTRTAQIQMNSCLMRFKYAILFLKQITRGEKKDKFCGTYL